MQGPFCWPKPLRSDLRTRTGRYLLTPWRPARRFGAKYLTTVSAIINLNSLYRAPRLQWHSNKLPSYSDTFLSPQLNLHRIKMFGYSDTVRSSSLSVTPFCHPNTVTVSGEACMRNVFGLEASHESQLRSDIATCSWCFYISSRFKYWAGGICG